MSTSAYGGELRLLSQVITLASKLGDAEQMLKALAGNLELLAFVLDYGAFHHGRSFTVHNDLGESVKIRLVCFSETSSVENDEVNRRVERLGRYATEKEFEQLFDILKGAEVRRELCYPIVTHTIPLSYRAKKYEYSEITWRSMYGSIELGNAGFGGTSFKKTGMVWAPSTFFAVVPHPQLNKPVLLPRPKSEE